MKYCPNCLEEYEDKAETCSDCAGQALVTEEELEKRPGFHRVREDEDTTDFAVAGDAEDPFEADAFTSAISEAGIPVLARTRHASSVALITSGIRRPYWEIRVPQAELARATEIIAARRLALQESEEDAAQAAEEEAGGATE
jgi:hypothetical protein